MRTRTELRKPVLVREMTSHVLMCLVKDVAR